MHRLRALIVWCACCIGGLAIAQFTFNGPWPVADVLAETVSGWNNKLLTPPASADDHIVRLVDLGAPAVHASQIIDLLDLLNYARAKAVLLYVDLGRLTRNEPEQAEALAAAVRRYASVVVAEGPSEDLGDWKLPNAVRTASAAVGHRHYLSAANRSVQGIATAPIALPATPSLHVIQALKRVADGSAGRAPTTEEVRVDGAVPLLLPYASAPGRFPGPPIGSLQPGSPELRGLRGKVVVIGSTEENPMATPYDSLALRKQPSRRMSEVEVGANYAAALLSGRLMRIVSPGETWVLLVATVLLCALPLLLMPPLAGYVASLALGAATLPTWWFVAQERMLVFGDAPQAAAAVMLTGLLWIVVSLWRSRRNAERLLEQLRSVRLPMRLAELTPPAPRAGRGDSLAVAQAAIEAAHANQVLTAAVIDGLPVAVLLVGAGGRVLAANRCTEQWFGSEEPVGRHIESLLRHFDFYAAGDGVQVLRAAHFSAEARCGSRHVMIDSRVLDAAGHGPIRMLGIQDVSLVKQAVNDRADAVDFLTHDLRTPLHSILVLTGLLERESPSVQVVSPAGTGSSVVSTMQQIRRMTERAIRLADNYVHLLRTDGATATAFAEVNLNDVIEEAVATSQPVAQEQRVMLRAANTPLCFVRGDYALLYRAVVNICGNAVRHAPAGSTVHIELACNEGEVVLAVRDEGQGFPVELLGRHVDRYRVGKQPKAQGIGLGLALVDAVARKHGGTLQLLNRPGGGAEVRLTLSLLEMSALPTLRMAS
jgi:signal transduction histidine kinase